MGLRRPQPRPHGAARPFVAVLSLQRIATLRRSGAALSEHEYARLKEVVLQSADGG
jgi:hypothetical protein